MTRKPSDHRKSGTPAKTDTSDSPPFLDADGEIEMLLSPFKKGRGKPTLRNDYLAVRRDAFIYRLEGNWARVGLALLRSQTYKDVQEAFNAIATETNAGLLGPLLRISATPSTAEQIKATRDNRDKAGCEVDRLDKIYKERSRSFDSLEHAVIQYSDDRKTQLEVDLKRRQKNLRNIKIAITNKKGQIRKAHLRQEKESSSGKKSPALDMEIRTYEGELRTLQTDFMLDTETCHYLTRELQSMTPGRRKLVVEEATLQEARQDSAKQELDIAIQHWESLQKKLLDQEAGFFQSQLLKFIAEARYEYSPRGLAGALAGLPYISCRRSAGRCAKLNESAMPIRRHYEVFLFTKRVLEGYKSKLKKSNLAEWFAQNILKFPRTTIVDGKRIPNEFRSYLTEKWYYLKRALEDYGKTKPGDPVSAPYVVTESFDNYRLILTNGFDEIVAKKAQLTG